MKKMIAKLLIGAALAGMLGACNTIAGVGEDVSAAGRGITRGADTTKQKM